MMDSSELPDEIRQLFDEKINIMAMYDELVKLLNRAQLTKQNYEKIRQLILDCTRPEDIDVE